jgi:hypothetical protein
MTHKFIVGQTVNLPRTILRQAAAGEYEILRLMPTVDGDPQNPCYRIKSIAENHERVVRESEISLAQQFDAAASWRR